MKNDILNYMFEVIECFHHIHHNKGSHEVHHCGGKHAIKDPKLKYKIRHCSCGKHAIDKNKACGHDFNHNKINFIFHEKCPGGGWHVESGKIKK
jgi:hypothetical protein